MAKIKSIAHKGFIDEFEARSTDPKIVAKELRERLLENKVVKLTLGMHISDLRAFFDGVTDELGEPLNIAEDFSNAGEQTGERWMEIRYDEDIPDLAAFRHSKNAQPLHTDESYIDDPCDVMVFYCKNKAPAGGQTCFVDGSALVERMKVIAPELLDKLSTTDVCYEKAGNKRVEKIIDLSIPGNPLLNFNYTCISKNETPENKKLNQDFLEFLVSHVRGSFLEIPVGLKPGESVYWWDHYVLHGRNPFEAYKTDDRFIWKTGVKWVD